MSASTERKKRLNDRENITMAQRKEAKKQAKEKRKWIIIAVVAAVLIAAVLYLPSGLARRSVSAYEVNNSAYKDLNIEAGSTDYSAAEFEYMFFNLYSQYANYMSSMGNVSLGNDCTEYDYQLLYMFGFASDPEYPGAGKESYTMRDCFMDCTRNQLRNLSILCAYAEANGVALDDEDQQTIDDSIASMKEQAKNSDYKNLHRLLAANYGGGCNENVVRDMMAKQILAGKVQKFVTSQYEVSQADIEAKYAEIADQYDNFSFEYYYVAAESVTADDGTSAPTDETLAAAKETAEKLNRQAADAETFAAAIAEEIGEVQTTETDENGESKEVTKTAEPVVNTDVAGNTFTNLDAELVAWLVDAGRRDGDHAVIETANGYYAVIFQGRETITDATEDSDGMPYCDFVAKQTIDNENYQQWYSTEMAALDNVFKGSDCYYIRFVGK